MGFSELRLPTPNCSHHGGRSESHKSPWPRRVKVGHSIVTVCRIKHKGGKKGFGNCGYCGDHIRIWCGRRRDGCGFGAGRPPCRTANFAPRATSLVSRNHAVERVASRGPVGTFQWLTPGEILSEYCSPFGLTLRLRLRATPSPLRSVLGRSPLKCARHLASLLAFDCMVPSKQGRSPPLLLRYV